MNVIAGKIMHVVPLLDIDIPVGIALYRVEIDLAASEAPLTPWLTTEERARTTLFTRREDRARFSQTRVALRILLAARLRCCPDNVAFTHNIYGKPFVVGDHDHLPLFNVSHAGALALIAIADRAVFSYIGVDIEKCQPEVNLTPLLNIAFTVQERDSIINEADIAGATYLRWAGKEAVLKASGFGIGVHLQHIAIFPRENGRLDVVSETPQWQGFEARQVDVAAGYVAAIAWCLR